MSDISKALAAEQLAALTIKEAADVLMKMPKREAMLLINEMPEQRGIEIVHEIFERDFSFYSGMMGEFHIAALNGEFKDDRGN